jgi:uncharacterized DUF497 family protein
VITFEWDPPKAATNLKKHQISFEEARSVFFDEFAVQFIDEAHSLDEELTWQRHDTPDAYLYELIVINQTNDQRSRTWHWFRDGVIYQRTLIEESKISD